MIQKKFALYRKVFRSKAKKTGKVKTGILRKPIDTIRGVRKSLLETLSNSSNRIDRLSENTSLYFTSRFPFRQDLIHEVAMN